MKLLAKVLPPMGCGIRSGAGEQFPIVQSLHQNDEILFDQKTENNWYHMLFNQGWVDGQYIQVIQNMESNTPQATDIAAAAVTGAAALASAQTTVTSTGLDSKIIQMLYDNMQASTAKFDASTRLFGAPHQFTKQTDFRPSNANFDLGRKFLSSIVSESPIVYFLPGKPNYLPDIDKNSRNGLTEFLKGKEADADNKSIIDKIIGNNDTRYFSFLSDYSVYMRYVNMLCRMSAVFIGLNGDNDKPPNSNTPYKHYDWANYRFENSYKQKQETKKSLFDLSEMKTDMYQALFGNYQYVQFYVEPNTSFSESANNSTTESKLAGMFQSAQGIIKELSFLTDSMAVSGVDGMKDTFAKGMNDISDKMIKNNHEGFFSRLLGMSGTVLNGSNIIFPQLWGDAAYNKSYNVTINLASPYGDKESIYLNIIVPLMHILALTLPRQTTANSYASPFLVKVFSKGWFSCEMGLIDSISIDKGSGQAWSVHGLPTEMRIQLGIKDLYSNLMITSNSSPDLFFNNHGMIEFLAVTCGLDITKPTFAVQVQAMFAALFNSVNDIPTNAYRDFTEKITNTIKGLYKII